MDDDSAAESAEETLGDEDYRRQAEFRHALRRFLHFSEEQATAEGVTPQQHLLLLMVRGHPRYPVVSIGDVADRLQIRHHSASLLVERCVQRGLLTRREDPDDRRKALVVLTDEGASVLQRITLRNRRELRAVGDELFGVRESLLRAFELPGGPPARRRARPRS